MARPNHEVDAVFLETLDASWRTEIGRLFPELGAPRRDQAAAEDYVRLFEAMARAVDHLALTRPLLLVLEDLHWADEMTLRMLVFIARRMAEWPRLLAVTVRVEEMVDATLLRRSLAQLGRMSGTISVPLSPLSRLDTVALIRTLAPPGSGTPWSSAWESRSSRPARATPSWSSSSSGRSSRAPTARSARRSTPRTARELIAARLDRLSDGARRLVAVASVIGREFEFALLQRAAGSTESEVAEGAGSSWGVESCARSARPPATMMRASVPGP